MYGVVEEQPTADHFRTAHRAATPPGSPVVVDEVTRVTIQDQLHEVRSCVAGLAGAVQVLTDEHAPMADGSRRRLGSMVVAEMERLQRLVSDPVVEPSRSRSEPPELLDLDELIAGLALLRSAAGQRVFWTSSRTQVRSHRDELVEVLEILLTNAARHAGTPVHLAAVETDGEVCLSVSDAGPGVPDEVRSEIFERGARRPDSPGQGLGLSIARDLVRGLGGTLVLDEDQGRGARFTVVLPAAALGSVA